MDAILTATKTVVFRGTLGAMRMILGLRYVGIIDRCPGPPIHEMEAGGGLSFLSGMNPDRSRHQS
jgi:hypothetical protein